MKSEYLDVSNLQITTDEAWENELKRLRKIYTERGALLASLLFPIIMVADYLYKMSEDGYVEWFIVRLAPSFLILITFLLLKNVNKQWKYHLLLFITIGSLFTSSAYKISEQQTWTSFLSSNVILVIAMSTLIVARGWLVYFLFGYFFFINLVLNIYQHQDETFTMFMSNYGVSLLALGAVFIFAAETRFVIMKRNFINSLALQNYLKLLEKQKHVIERKNEDITASINYAQKIQKNILPRPEEIEEYIEEYFILFKPRDIVSGDFYWFTHIPNSLTSNHEVLLWVVADCTGHGVPGALMSMLGNELLNEIVFHQHITSPEDILTLLHEGIFKTLKQKEGNSQDGMDISVLLIDKIDKTVEFAGAKHTLIFTKNGDFFEVKGDKFSIGGSLRGDKPCFTCNKIHLEQDTEYIFYMFSDGYQDQFGGPQNKKFLSKNFKKLLHKNHSLDMNVQKQILDDTLEEWRVLGQQAQIDDILVTGIKLKV